MLKPKSPKKKPLKLFGKEYADPTPKQMMFLSGFIVFMFYGLALNYYAIGSAVELYTGINKFIGFIAIFAATFYIKKSNFLSIGKDISKVIWMTLNMIGLYCVLNYFDWSSIHKFGLLVFSIVGFVQTLFFHKDFEDNEESNEKEKSDK